LQSGIGDAGFSSGIPGSLCLLLAHDPQAMNRFNGLLDAERGHVLEYVMSGSDDYEMGRRMHHTVKSLHNGIPGFYLQ